MRKANTMKHRVLYMLVSGVLFSAFLALGYAVHKGYLDGLDFDTTVRLQDNIPRRFDGFFSSLSLLGSFELTGIAFVVMVLFGVRKLRRLAILAIFPAFHVIELLGKMYIEKEPPPFMFLRYSFGFHFPSSYISTDHYSFPSGHVGRTALLTGMGIFLLWKSKLHPLVKFGLSAVFMGILGIMIVSRIYLGEHWASDTVGGSLLGFAFVLLSAVVW